MELYGKLKDSDLLLLIREGDELAFTQLYNTYWKKLYYQAVTKLKDEPEAEEAVQHIFVKLWEKRERLTVTGSLESYLASAVRYQIIDRKQKAIRRAMLEEKIGKATDEDIRSTYTPDLSEEYFEKLQSRVEKVIDTLPPKCQLVFRMSREEEHTNKTIAAQLGISEKAVEKHVTKALKTLKKNLGETAMVIITVGELFRP